MPENQKILLEIQATESNGQLIIDLRSSGASFEDIKKMLLSATAAHIYSEHVKDKSKLNFDTFLNAYDTFNKETLSTTLSFIKSIGCDTPKITH